MTFKKKKKKKKTQVTIYLKFWSFIDQNKSLFWLIMLAYASRIVKYEKISTRIVTFP